MSRITYPRAVPVHSPDELAARSRKLERLQETLSAQARQAELRDQELDARKERLKRWSAGLIAAAGLLLLGVFTYAFHQPAAIPTAAPADPPSPVADIKPATESAPPKESAAPKAEPVVAAKVDLLEALGNLSAAHLYQSHLNIGLLADGVESGTYTIPEAEESLQPVLDLMKQVDTRLAKLAKSDLNPADRRGIQQIQAVGAMLKLQADALRTYWSTGDVKRASEFQAARKASWEGLSKAMGIR